MRKTGICALLALVMILTVCRADEMPVIDWSERTTPPPRWNYSALSMGDESDEVLNMQIRLQELGYISGGAYGKYGPRTAEAVKEAQSAFGLEPTGIADGEFLEILFSSSTRAILQSGDEGEEVLRMQERLSELGYITGGSYGKYGPRTVEAVKEAQAAFGLEPTGIADNAFLERLFE